jgi:hypothetical protein
VRRLLGILLPILGSAAIAAPAAAAAGPGAVWGGAVTATDGEIVSVSFSQDYPQDPARQLQWADFLTSLVHGPELQSVSVLFTPLQRVQAQCGADALACYAPETHTIVLPGDELPDGPSLQSILIHEYGHHIAATRANPPWDANDYGPKRWATAVGVCRKAADGQLFPGDEGIEYDRNPAEVFAEDYRVLNEQRLGLAVGSWDIVDDSLQPDATVLAALEQDVVSPWEAPTISTYSGSFRRLASPRPRRFTIATPLDGTVRVSLAAPKGTRFRLFLNGKARTSATVCGMRTVTATVQRISGFGNFRLAVSAA